MFGLSHLSYGGQMLAESHFSFYFSLAHTHSHFLLLAIVNRVGYLDKGFPNANFPFYSFFFERSTEECRCGMQMQLT